MKRILVTGAHGQLSKCLKKQAGNYKKFTMFYRSSRELDITCKTGLREFFQTHQIDVCINAAAYTNVEAAENEQEKAFSVNAEGAGNIAEVCREHGSDLFHFSTDYVFNGRSRQPYSETDKVDPLNVYGTSKLKGEKEIMKKHDRFFIFRTSWLYSEFGHNFLLTILKKAEEKAILNITAAQTGTPTNANDLAAYVLKIISSGSRAYGLYHFSNEGQATWYDFAKEILTYSGKLEQVTLNKTGFFKTLAVRPEYSVLSKERFTQTFGKVKNWKSSLHGLLDSIQ